MANPMNNELLFWVYHRQAYLVLYIFNIVNPIYICGLGKKISIINKKKKKKWFGVENIIHHLKKKKKKSHNDFRYL